MKKICKTIIILFCLPVSLLSSQKAGIEYNFTKDDSSYSFRGSFIVNNDFDCLLDVVYKFEHISKFTSGAKSIKLRRRGENWYEVTYTYRKLLIFENKSTWRRTLKREKGRVVFEMVSNKNNLSIIPEVLSSTGYYQVKPDDNGFRIEYCQGCVLKPGLLKNAYIRQAKKEAIKFLALFKKYVEKICD
jgi:hypothetical protein